MLLSGQTVIVGLGNSGGSVLYLDTESGAGACSPAISFTALDAVVNAYPTNLLLAPATEGGTNSWTPACVWSQAQADASYLPYAQNTAYLRRIHFAVGKLLAVADGMLERRGVRQHLHDWRDGGEFFGSGADYGWERDLGEGWGSCAVAGWILRTELYVWRVGSELLHGEWEQFDCDQQRESGGMHVDGTV